MRHTSLYTSICDKSKFGCDEGIDILDQLYMAINRAFAMAFINAKELIDAAMGFRTDISLHDDY